MTIWNKKLIDAKGRDVVAVAAVIDRKEVREGYTAIARSIAMALVGKDGFVKARWNGEKWVKDDMYKLVAVGAWSDRGLGEMTGSDCNEGFALVKDAYKKAVRENLTKPLPQRRY